MSETVGIAFSGGGNRALTSGSGILRALQRHGALDKTAYISGSSGGGWLTAIYTFNQTVTADELLNTARVVPPSQLTVANSSDVPKNAVIFQPTANFTAYLAFACVPNLLRSLGSLLCCGYEALGSVNLDWKILVWKAYFQPYGVKRNRYFAGSAAEVDAIVAANGGCLGNCCCLGLTASDFVTPASYATAQPLITMSMYGPPGVGGCSAKASAITAMNETDALASTTAAAGGLSPSDARAANYNIAMVTYSVEASETATYYSGPPMEISKALVLAANSIIGAGAQQFNIVTNPNDAKRRELLFADGGNHENSAVLPLLQKGVGKVLAMDSSPNPYEPYATWLNPVEGGTKSRDAWAAFALSTTTTSLFGVKLVGDGFDNYGEGYCYGTSQVFPRAAFDELTSQFDQCLAQGRPLVATLKNVQVLENTFFGIKAGFVDYTLVYVQAAQKWIDQVPAATLANIELVPAGLKINTLGALPFYKITYNNEGEPMRLTALQVNALADLLAWTIDSEWDAKIQQIFSGSAPPTRMAAAGRWCGGTML
ncbi:hypothetical protein T492DRAFT_961660 [Pavlovales sp. CCMP2436]|nr:hypothetical protein T492DRAFT_961660 [Pavlovales sp. CCMP2436]